MELTPEQVRAGLRGAVFPSVPTDLVEVARRNGAPDPVCRSLERLTPGLTVESVEEVIDELNLEQRTLEDTGELRAALGMDIAESLLE